MRFTLVLSLLLVFIGSSAAPQVVKEQLPPTKERGTAPGPIPKELRPEPRPQVVIPELTEVPVVLRDTLRTGYSKIDGEVLYFVGKDVYGLNHTLLIAAGTPAVGHVIRSIPSRSFGTAGYLLLTCDYILAQDKTRIPLRRTQVDARGKDRKGNALLSAVLAGAGSGEAAEHSIRGVRLPLYAVGASIAGTVVAASTTGHDYVVPRGSVFNVSVDADTATAQPVLVPTADLPDLLLGVGQSALVQFRGGGFAHGILNRVGDTLVLSTRTGTQEIRRADVLEIQYYKDSSTR